MYEFYLVNTNTGAQKTIFGYDINNAFQRANLEGEGWEVIYTDYVD